MSPVNRVGSVTGRISPWVHLRKFSLVFEMRKGQRSWGRVLAPNLGNKANMETQNFLLSGFGNS